MMAPQTFIDSMTSKKHLMLVSDDTNKGHAIEFHFIKRGLERKENCIYLTHGQVKQIENQMKLSGIDVASFKKKNLLHIYQIKNPLEDTRGIMDGIHSLLKNLLPNPELPFRIVGRLIPDVGIEEAITIQAYVEKVFHHSIFERLNGSVLCTYDISQIKQNDKWKKWLYDLQDSHHACIMNLDEQTSVTINPNEID